MRWYGIRVDSLGNVANAMEKSDLKVAGEMLTHPNESPRKVSAYSV